MARNEPLKLNMVNQLKSLFSQLCITLKENNYNEAKNIEKDKKYLKLDYNSVYGGYRIDWVHPDTSESFFLFSSRFSKKEMVAFIQGLIAGIEKQY